MSRDWDDPYMLEPRPMHRATPAERAEFDERLLELGLIAAHLGASLDVKVTFQRSLPVHKTVKPRKPAPKPNPEGT